MKNVQLAINSTTDCDIANRAITFYGADVATPVIDFINTKSPVIKTVYAAETAGVVTIVYTDVNSVTCSFILRQQVGDVINVFPISYTTTADNALSDQDAAFGAILDQLIASGALKATYTNTVSGTIVVTAASGYPLLSGSEGTNISSVTQTTTGKYAVNKGADLLAAGVENAVSGNTYTSFEFLTANRGNGAGQERLVWEKLTLYIKTGDTSIAKLTTILNADIFDTGQVELLS
jgi:hypothetical protein